MSIVAYTIFNPISGYSEIDILDMAEAYIDEPPEMQGPHEESCDCDLCFQWRYEGRRRWLNSISSRPCSCSQDQLEHVGCDCAAEDDRYTDEEVQAAYRRAKAQQAVRFAWPPVMPLRRAAMSASCACWSDPDALPFDEIPF